jgi:hypothetical protein
VADHFHGNAGVLQLWLARFVRLAQAEHFLQGEPMTAAQVDVAVLRGKSV